MYETRHKKCATGGRVSVRRVLREKENRLRKANPQAECSIIPSTNDAIYNVEPPPATPGTKMYCMILMTRYIRVITPRSPNR